jgi:hypothetical protein
MTSVSTPPASVDLRLDAAGQRPDAARAGLKAEAGDLVAQDAAAAAGEIRGEALDGPARVGHEVGLVLEEAVAEDRRQARLELAQLVGAQQLEPLAEPGHEPPLGRCGGEARVGLVDLEPADRAQQLLGAALARQIAPGRRRAAVEGGERHGDRLDPLGPAGAEQLDQPRGDARQVAPAQHHGPERIQHHPRHLLQDPRQGERRTGGVNRPAGIAEGGAGPRRARVEHRDRVAVALQVERGGHADDAGTDDSDAPGAEGVFSAQVSGSPWPAMVPSTSSDAAERGQIAALDLAGKI